MVFQFRNSHIEPFSFLEGDQVDFTQEFDDLGLGWVHERIMAVVVAGDAVGLPGWCDTSWTFGGNTGRQETGIFRLPARIIEITVLKHDDLNHVNITVPS